MSDIEREAMERYWINAVVADFADELALALEDRGWTVEELARRSRVSAGHIRRLLSGQRNFTIKTLGKIGYALGVHPRLSLDVVHKPGVWTKLKWWWFGKEIA